jgi:DNA-binding MarR family transcriptional regulator
MVVDIVRRMDDDVRNEYPTPTLMRLARGAYAQSIRTQLQAIGVDDLPRNGAFILGGIEASGGPRRDFPSELGVSKQAVSQVIDLLVNRGYVERKADSGDRRRVDLRLTDRGQEVAEATGRGVEAVDRQLEARVSHEQIEAMRSGLMALAEIKTTAIATGAGTRRPARELRRFSPIFPVRHLGRALEHYASLGFDTLPYEDGHEYGFANRDGIDLHLAVVDEEHASSPGSAYLYVRDADALYAEWSRPGIGGQTRPVGPTPYKLREGSHVDPDGNLIRFGSPIPE